MWTNQINGHVAVGLKKVQAWSKQRREDAFISFSSDSVSLLLTICNFTTNLVEDDMENIFQKLRYVFRIKTDNYWIKD